jgi:hypothetical protein
MRNELIYHGLFCNKIKFAFYLRTYIYEASYNYNPRILYYNLSLILTRNELCTVDTFAYLVDRNQTVINCSYLNFSFKNSSATLQLFRKYMNRDIPHTSVRA